MANTSTVEPWLALRFASYLEEKSDPRTKDWFLLQGLSPMIAVIVAYNLFCTKIGPALMRDRKPFELRTTLIVYNALNVIGSIYMFIEGMEGGWKEYSFLCQPVDYSTSPKAMRMAGAVYFYFLCKLFELLDTVFFVMRKKSNQVTFLHLFHHSLMPIVSWVGAKYVPGGHGTLLGIINSLVHIVMYSYYLVAALGPQYHKYLWWKKYLTIMQLVQFVIIFTHQLPHLFIECDYPKPLITLLAILSLFFMYLFGSFYVNAYIRKAKTT